MLPTLTPIPVSSAAAEMLPETTRGAIAAEPWASLYVNKTPVISLD